MPRLLFLLLLLPVSLPAAGPEPLACASDWQQEAKLARARGVPILVVFTADTCTPCDRLKHQLIEPMRASEQIASRVHITEFDINRGGKVVDFDGERVRSGVFVARYDVFATPTVLLLDHQGHRLTDPLVGYDASEDYAHRLEDAITEAGIGLAGRLPDARTAGRP